MIAAGTDKAAAPRAGSLGLSLLAVPLNVTILEALAKKPKTMVGLRRAAGAPPATTMQRHLRTLARASALEPRGRDRIADTTTFGLTPAGHGLVGVASVLRAWLTAAPDREEELGTADAAKAIMPLVSGWSIGTVRVLAAGPHSAEELGRIIPGAKLSALESQLAAMHQAGLIEPAPGADTARFQPTPRLRHAIAPLAAAASWEQQNGLEGANPISRLEVESAFLLAIPLVELPRQVNGTCRLVVEVQAAGGFRQAGAFITVERGQVTSCVTRIQGQAESWVSGSPTAWLHAVMEGKTESLDVAGSGPLASALLEGLHQALFGSPLDQ